MVGIVVVSHSRPLARAAVALASEMVPSGGVAIAVAAGLDDTTTGTDAVAVADAILEVDAADGVVVLLDLGSAVLSAELALELLPDEVRARVLLSPAPLVEGLVAAVVTAAAGASAREVAAEAADALAGKQSHLAGTPDGDTGAAGDPPAAEAAAAAGAIGDSDAAPTEAAVAGNAAGGAGTGGVLTASVVVDLPHGLHARPAARVVATVRDLDAEVTLARPGGAPAAARSLSRLSALGIRSGETVEVRATGREAAAAVDALQALAARGFDEVPAGPADPRPDSAATGDASSSRPGPAAGAADAGADAIVGPDAVTVLAGLAVGPAVRLEEPVPRVPEVEPGTPDEHRRRLAAAVDSVRGDLGRTADGVRTTAGAAAAAIFDAHLALLEDPAVLDVAFAAVAAGRGPAAAWESAVTEAAQGVRDLDDPYLRGRADDVRAVGDAVLVALLGPGPPPDRGSSSAAGEPRGPLAAAGPAGPAAAAAGIVLAADLTPADAAALDPTRVSGVVLAGGSPTAHAAILVRSLGIPMLVGAGARVLAVEPGVVLGLDTAARWLVVDPDAATTADLQGRIAAAAGRSRDLVAAAGQPAMTLDNVVVEVGANVGSVADATQAASSGADGAGLVRTEFCFTGRTTAPDAADQEEVYEGIAAALHPHRVVLRTLDVGGDKPLAFLPLPAEANPFLGVRGLRVSLARPDLFRVQLSALLAVAERHPISVMFPMVSTLDELRAARELLDEVARGRGGAPTGLRVGMMVEVPAAAVKAAVFAPHVDFFSVGTNDLTQYALAAERGNQALSALADALDPGVLGLIDLVCRGAAGVSGPAGEPVAVAVCGEAAADPDAVGILLGLGVRELSVAAPAVPAVKDRVRRTDLRAAADLARRALGCEDAAAVRELAREAAAAGGVPRHRPE